MALRSIASSILPRGTAPSCSCHAVCLTPCRFLSWNGVGSEAGIYNRSTAPGRVGQSIQAARNNTRPRPRRNHRDAPYASRSGNSETARPAVPATPADPPQTWPPPGASSCCGCGCQPSARPSDRHRPAPARGSRSVSRAGASSTVADAGLDLPFAIRIPNPTAGRRRSARRRDTADSVWDRRHRA